MRSTKYIKCGKHMERRWSIVCKHLCEGDSRDWNPIPQSEGDGINDWVCPECLKDWDRMNEERDIRMVCAVCVECVKSLRFLFDKNYDLQRESGKSAG